MNIDTQSYYDNGYNNGYSEGDNNGYERGYDEGVDNGIQEQKAKLESITIESNGTYIKEDGYNEVIVALDIPKTKIYNGFRFVSEGNNDYKRIKDIDFSQYDWSRVYDLSYFFENFKSSNSNEGLVASDFDNFVENFNGDILSCANMFENSNALLESPDFGDITANCVDMTRMFYYCLRLKNIPLFNTSNVTDMTMMFNSCSSLTSIPLLNTSNVTNMLRMFGNCSRLANLPLLDTSNVTDMTGTFAGCSRLANLPLLDTSNVSLMTETFLYCSSLTTIPLLNTSKVTNMKATFQNCTSLTTIPQIDTSNVTIMTDMFRDCQKLTSIPQLDTSSVANMQMMFYNGTVNTPALTSVPLLDTGNVTNISGVFGCSSVYLSNFTDFGGFKDLGKQNSISGTENNGFLDRCPSLTHESLMNVINNLYDRKSAGYSSRTLKFGTDHLNKLSDEEKAIAINKGWKLS